MRADEKAVSTFADLMQRYTVARDFVVDVFAGTFTSGIAALEQDRCYLGCESDQACYDLAMTRLERIAGNVQDKRWKTGSDEVLPLAWPDYICPPDRTLAGELGTAEQTEYDTPASKAELAVAQVRAPHHST